MQKKLKPITLADGHIVLISDEQVTVGVFDRLYFNTYDNRIWQYRPAPSPMPYWGNLKTLKELVATSDQFPKIEGVLQYVVIDNFESELEKLWEDKNHTNDSFFNSIVSLHKAFKEKHEFTEADMVALLDFSRKFAHTEGNRQKPMWGTWNFNQEDKDINAQQLFKLFVQSQQPKLPDTIEVEYRKNSDTGNNVAEWEEPILNTQGKLEIRL